jgi:hypothetical protein
MQNERWLISSGPEQEPFSLSAGPGNFPVWIEDEAAQPVYEQEDVTRTPTVPQQTMWRHESPDYQVESSLSSLSLVSVDDSPPAVRPPSIDELDTLPPARRRQRDEMLPARPARKNWPQHDYYGLVPRPRDVSELTTNPPPPVPSAKLRDEQFVVSSLTEDVIEADTLFSTAIPLREASPVLHPVSGRLPIPINGSRLEKRQEFSLALHPLDRVRWWLLYPGRLELLLWVTGTALLVAITCVLLFVTTIGLGIVSIGHSTGALSTASAAQCVGAPVSAGVGHCDSSTAMSPAGLKITLQNTTALLTSTPVQLRGDGFSPRGRVTFSYDNNRSCSPASVQADGHGTFIVTLTLAGQPALRPGHHRVVVYDQARGQSVSLDILFTADTTSQ